MRWRASYEPGRKRRSRPTTIPSWRWKISGCCYARWTNPKVARAGGSIKETLHLRGRSLTQPYYTLASWHVAEDKEQEFVRVWRDELAPAFRRIAPNATGTL